MPSLHVGTRPRQRRVRLPPNWDAATHARHARVGTPCALGIRIAPAHRRRRRACAVRSPSDRAAGLRTQPLVQRSPSGREIAPVNCAAGLPLCSACRGSHPVGNDGGGKRGLAAGHGAGSSTGAARQGLHERVAVHVGVGGPRRRRAPARGRRLQEDCRGRIGGPDPASLRWFPSLRATASGARGSGERGITRASLAYRMSLPLDPVGPSGAAVATARAKAEHSA